MKKFIPVLIVLILLLSGCARHVNRDIESYDEDRVGIGYAAGQMPDLDEIGNYSDVRYTHKKALDLFFVSHGFALFAQYDSAEYEKEKADILDTYTFLEEPVMCSLDDDYEIPLTEFDYKGYSMFVAYDQHYSNSCKTFAMVGFNDEKCAIVHLYYYDQDLDYIAEKDDDLHEEMVDFMDESFSWVNMKDKEKEPTGSFVFSSPQIPQNPLRTGA